MPEPFVPPSPALIALHRRGLRFILAAASGAIALVIVVWALKSPTMPPPIEKARLILLSVLAGSLGASLRLAVMPIDDWRKTLDQAGDLSPLYLAYCGGIVAGPLMFFAVDSGALVAAVYGKSIAIADKINETGVCFQAMVAGLFVSQLVKTLERKFFPDAMKPAEPPRPFPPPPGSPPPLP